MRIDDPSARVLRLVPSRPDRLDAVPIAQVQGTLALDLGSSCLPALAGYDDSLRSRAESADVGELRTWSATFAQAVVESIGGDRPVSQLLRWTHPSVYRDLARRVHLVGLARTHGRKRVLRPQVRSVHLFQPGPGCAEVSVHVRHGERSRCLAARLEQRAGRWLCTALEVG